MTITIEKIIELLNSDLEQEYAAAIQFTYHSAVMSGASCGLFIRELEIYAKEKIGHAAILSNQIHCLGGAPSTKVAEVLVSGGEQEMLEQDRKTHDDAMKRLSERIEQAGELHLFLLAQQLSNILEDEQRHALERIKVSKK